MADFPVPQVPCRKIIFVPFFIRLQTSATISSWVLLFENFRGARAWVFECRFQWDCSKISSISSESFCKNSNEAEVFRFLFMFVFFEGLLTNCPSTPISFPSESNCILFILRAGKGSIKRFRRSLILHLECSTVRSKWRIKVFVYFV